METKKCPKCGAEIPVEMSFCLHCMERTDGVLEIKRKAVPSRKYVIAAIIAFTVLLTAIVLLIFALNGKDNNSEPEPVTASEAATETSTESVQADTTVQSGLTTQTQTTATAETAENSTSTTVEDTVVSSEDSTSPQNESVISTEEDVPEEPVTTPVETTAPIAINFEEVFTERMNSWGAPHILADTLYFNENGCRFTSNVGTDKVNCTVTSDAAMTEYTLTIEPSSEFTRYGTSIYIPDIVNEMTYFVLGRRMNSSTRTAIADMFENFEAGGRFTENGLTCDISTQVHNNGSYPITVNCKITE